MDVISQLETLLAQARAEAVAVAAPVVEAAVTEIPVEVPADAALPVVAADIAEVHARVDGVASALVMAIQSLDAKIDAGLDVASGWALHPKVAAAATGGLVATIAAYVTQLNGVHIAGGQTTASAAAAFVAFAAAWLKRA